MSNEEKAASLVLDIVGCEVEVCTGPTCKCMATALAALTEARAQGRREGLEEAAKAADDYANVARDAHKCAHCDDGPNAAKEIASFLRALKDQDNG